jgi:sugar/nucleoside kinase (ribokinase family)
VVSEHSDRFTSVVTPVLPHVDYLIVNEFEASKSTGIDVDAGGKVDPAGASRAAQRLLDLGVHEWVFVHWPEGALARHRDGQQARQGSVKVPAQQVAGTAGAGDAFAAGALLGLHEGWDIQDCLRMGVCTAASNLFHPTCTESIKTREECLKLGEECGFRAL